MLLCNMMKVLTFYVSCIQIYQVSSQEVAPTTKVSPIVSSPIQPDYTLSYSYSSFSYTYNPILAPTTKAPILAPTPKAPIEVPVVSPSSSPIQPDYTLSYSYSSFSYTYNPPISSPANAPSSTTVSTVSDTYTQSINLNLNSLPPQTVNTMTQAQKNSFCNQQISTASQSSGIAQIDCVVTYDVIKEITSHRFLQIGNRRKLETNIIQDIEFTMTFASSEVDVSDLNQNFQVAANEQTSLTSTCNELVASGIQCSSADTIITLSSQPSFHPFNNPNKAPTEAPILAPTTKAPILAPMTKAPILAPTPKAPIEAPVVSPSSSPIQPDYSLSYSYSSFSYTYNPPISSPANAPS